MDSRVVEGFAAQGMMCHIGAVLETAGDGVCRIRAPIGPEVSQQAGFAHAGLAFTIGDSAAGFAALTLMPDGCDVVTVEMKINLTAPAKGAALVATGRVIQPGRRLFVVQTEVVAHAADDTPIAVVAVMQGTMALRRSQT